MWSLTINLKEAWQGIKRTFKPVQPKQKRLARDARHIVLSAKSHKAKNILRQWGTKWFIKGEGNSIHGNILVVSMIDISTERELDLDMQTPESSMWIFEEKGFPMYVIGDCHGKILKYLQTLHKLDTFAHETGSLAHSVQIGDLGYDYGFFKEYKVGKTHKFFAGNHDAYNQLPFQLENHLGDYGQRKFGGVDFFIVRGGHSIDQKVRHKYIDYFPEEELNQKQGLDCIEQYSSVKPRIVLSHEAPRQIAKLVCPDSSFIESWGYDKDWSSSTQELLQQLYEIHQPVLWIFGHYHRSWQEIIYPPDNKHSTAFICLNELEFIEVHPDGTAGSRNKL